MALREVLAEFTINVRDAALQKSATGIEKMIGSLRDMGAALIVTDRVKTFITDLVNAGDAIIDTSARLGVNTTELQRWQLAAKLSGVEAETFNGALTKFQKQIGEAATGNATATDAFKAIGVSIKDANGEIGSSTDLLRGAAAGIAEIKDPALRTKAAMDLFGKSGAALLPMFEGGAEGVEELLKELDKLGGGFSEDSLEAIGAMGDEMDRFEFSLTSLKAQMAIAVLPTLTRGLKAFSELASSFARSEQGARLLKTGVQVLGAVALVSGLRMVAPYAGFAILLAALVLLIDDVKTGLEGGDSLTGRFLDRVFGKGSGESIFKQIKNDWNDLVRDVKGKPLGDAVAEGFSRAGASIVKFFVADIPEALEIATANVQDGAAGTGEKIAVALKDSVIQALIGLPNVLLLNATEASAKFINGLANGIRSGAGAIAAAVTDMVKSAIFDTIDSALENRSPSHAAERKGGFVGPGLAIGIRKGIPEVAQATRDLSKPVLALATGGNSSRSYTSYPSVNVNVHGTGPSAARRGVFQGLEDDRLAALNALESTS